MHPSFVEFICRVNTRVNIKYDTDSPFTRFNSVWTPFPCYSQTPQDNFLKHTALDTVNNQKWFYPSSNYFTKRDSTTRFSSWISLLLQQLYSIKNKVVLWNKA